MRLVSYNIRLALDSSLDRIARVVHDLEADAVCLQEVGRYWAMGPPVDMRTVLSAQTGLPHAVFAPAIQRGPAQYGIAVLSRYPLEVLARPPLPQRQDEPRVLLACRLHAADESLLLLTSHVSVVGGDRPAQFAAIGDCIGAMERRQSLPLALVGDLNAELQEPALIELMGRCGLRSAHVEVLGAVPPTFPTKSPERAIDHILMTEGLAVSRAGVESVDASDHLPVWADVSPRCTPA